MYGVYEETVRHMMVRYRTTNLTVLTIHIYLNMELVDNLVVLVHIGSLED